MRGRRLIRDWALVMVAFAALLTLKCATGCLYKPTITVRLGGAADAPPRAAGGAASATRPATSDAWDVIFK